ncbi:MAG: alpha/beta fold hydrolase [Acidiphilium sp.]|nr:alpha/beta fold hydrolase [Acidiphilium sp.]MDD4936936.1 alpha/beta fold hydrolase [Acidiphilium sp.]
MTARYFTVDVGPLRHALLAYATWGQLNATGDNAVLLPSYFTGTHENYVALIGPGMALDPDRYFIIAPNLFGNGISTSPSHGVAWSPLSIEDNVHAQHELLRHLGVRRVALAAGWSIGAMQALHWAMMYPAEIGSVVAVCGSAFCWPINAAFLEGITPILKAVAPIDERLALGLFGRAYCSWAYSAEFFRTNLYRMLGFANLEALFNQWEGDHQQHRSADLLAVLHSWTGTAREPTLARSGLSRISARCFVMPCYSDSYFTVQDAVFEAGAIPNAVLRPITSPYGHCAGAPGRFDVESAQIETTFAEALSVATTATGRT